jgi:hypothetical protein
MRTGTGAFELEVPRDRNSSFEPQLIKKRQTILNEELDNNRVESPFTETPSHTTVQAMVSTL